MRLFALAAMLATSAPAFAMSSAVTGTATDRGIKHQTQTMSRAKYVRKWKARLYRRMVRLDEGGN